MSTKIAISHMGHFVHLHGFDRIIHANHHKSFEGKKFIFNIPTCKYLWEILLDTIQSPYAFFYLYRPVHFLYEKVFSFNPNAIHETL